MTDLDERARIARELAEDLGWHSFPFPPEGVCWWIRDTGERIPVSLRDALIDARIQRDTALAERDRLKEVLEGIVARFTQEDERAGNESFDERRSPLAWAMYTDAKAAISTSKEEPSEKAG